MVHSRFDLPDVGWLLGWKSLSFSDETKEAYRVLIQKKKSTRKNQQENPHA